MNFWNWMFREPKPIPAPSRPPEPVSPPLTAEEFSERYRRNYVNYAALIDTAFAMGEEAWREYERMDGAERAKVVVCARDHAWSAR